MQKSICWVRENKTDVSSGNNGHKVNEQRWRDTVQFLLDAWKIRVRCWLRNRLALTERLQNVTSSSWATTEPRLYQIRPLMHSDKLRYCVHFAHNQSPVKRLPRLVEPVERLGVPVQVRADQFSTQSQVWNRSSEARPISNLPFFKQTMALNWISLS